MTKYYLLSILLTVSICSVHSQNADQNTITSSGDAVTNSSAQLSWTIGQTVASSSSSNSIFLNQGFQQSDVITIELGTSPEAQVITIYPNPTVDYVTVQASEKRGFGSYQLTSLKGEILINQQHVDFSRVNKINMMDFADGVYLLFIKNEDQLKQFKIIKN